MSGGGSGSSLFGNAFSIGGGGQSSFMQMSCIDRLFNGGLNIIFQPPNLGNILRMLEQAICAKANQMFATLMRPITQTLGQVTSMGGTNMLGGGGFFPGLSLSSLGGGINANAGGSGFSVGIGGVGQVGTNAGISSVLNGDVSWYARPLPLNSPSSRSFDGLFGNSGSGGDQYYPSGNGYGSDYFGNTQ
jgi:hypothetical protein